MRSWGQLGATALLCVSATAFTAQYVSHRPAALRTDLERELDCITRQIQIVHERVMCDEDALEKMPADDRLEYDRLCRRWRALQQRISQASREHERGPLDRLN
jgi:hypothetical protein